MARAIDPKAKAKRQKIIAAVGGVILIGLLAWRVPPMIALMNKKPAPPPVVAPAPTAPIPGAPVSPSVPPVGAPDSGDLADSDPAPAAGPGQLVSFGRFLSKDPFVPQAGKRCADDSGAAIPCTGPTTGSGSSPKAPIKAPEPELSQPTAPTTKPAGRTSAKVSVDGTTESVSVNSTFPAADPVFKLVSVSATSAKVAIDGGTYATGASSITLRKGQAVTLVNTADGTRYRVVLVSTG
jgi:hypothetical protein